MLISEYAAIYLGSKEANGRPLHDQDVLLEWLLIEMAREFGGATATQVEEGQGAWITPAGVMVVEPVAIVKAFCRSARPHSDRLRALARELKRRARQEAVAIETTRGMDLV